MAKLATIFGGSGFVGRYVARRLAKQGWRVRVAVRRPNEAGFVRPYGVPGQVEPILSNIRYEHSVDEAIGNADAVVNCVGILSELKKQKFDSLHVEGAERIARMAAIRGVGRLVHISSIGASKDSTSLYARSKAAGEEAVANNFADAAILRPSVIFGDEDQFFNRFAAMARYFPVIPLAGGNTRFQPVYVDDVAHAVEICLTSPGKRGIYELGGPDTETFRQLIENMLRIIRRRRLVLNMPGFMASLVALEFDVLQFASGGLFVNRVLTRDQVRQLALDNVVGQEARTFADLNMDPTAMEAVLEQYLYKHRPAGQFAALHDSFRGMSDLDK